MSGRTVRFTSSRPWAAGRFDALLLCFLLPYFLPAWRRPHRWLAVCCEPLTPRRAAFLPAKRGRNRCGISLGHETQTREASEIKHPLCLHSASRRRWRRGGLRYGPGFQRWASRVPASGLFIGMPDTQEGAFLPGPPNELHTRGRPVLVKPHGTARAGRPVRLTGRVRLRMSACGDVPPMG